MRHVARCTVAAFVCFLLAGCRDNAVQPTPTQIDASIIDGNHGGNPNFFFLPPLVANPKHSPNFKSGAFNPRLSPVVEVCELAANPILVPTTDCKAGPLAFGPAKMALAGTDDDDPFDIDDNEGHYRLNWDTKASNLIVTSFYRVTVRGAIGGTALGLLDVEPVLGGVRKMKDGEVFVFRDDRTLPIKVRIQQGAFGSTNPTDFVEQVVPNVLPATGLDVTTNTKFAGAHFTNGWLPVVNGQPLDQVVVIIERIPVNDVAAATSCLNTPLEQLEGCYRFRTDPDLHTLVPGTDLPFAAPVVVGICFQYPADIGSPTGRPFELYRSEETAAGLAPATPLLNEVAAPFLRCDTFGPTPPSIGAALRSGRLGDIAKAGLFAITHAIGRVTQPPALHAVDLGAGGSPDGFSRFGWARHATMTVTAGNGAIAPAGSTVQASVQVQTNHHGEVHPVGGQAVTFTVTSGSGSVIESQPVYTDASGIAAVSWRLGVGVNTLQVTATQVDNSPQTITATGTPIIAGKPLYVANQGGASVTVYAPGASGNATPTTTIVGSNTGLNGPFAVPYGIAHDAVGNIYVTMGSGNSIVVFAAGASGNATPMATIAGGNTGLNFPTRIALDGAGNIYVANTGADNILVFPAGASGNATPMATMAGATTGTPIGIALDGAGKIYVTNWGGNSILIFAALSSGNATPIATIAGDNTGLSVGNPHGIAVDGAGNIYVTNPGAQSIIVFAAGASGNATPIATIAGDKTGLVGGPYGIAVDGAGNIYVSNIVTVNNILVFAAGASGNATPTATIFGGNTGLNVPFGITF